MGTAICVEWRAHPRLQHFRTSDYHERQLEGDAVSVPAELDEQTGMLEMFNRAWDSLTEDERREERAEREWLLAVRTRDL